MGGDAVVGGVFIIEGVGRLLSVRKRAKGMCL